MDMEHNNIHTIDILDSCENPADLSTDKDDDNKDKSGLSNESDTVASAGSDKFAGGGGDVVSESSVSINSEAWKDSDNEDESYENLSTLNDSIQHSDKTIDCDNLIMKDDKIKNVSSSSPSIRNDEDKENVDSMVVGSTPDQDDDIMVNGLDVDGTSKGGATGMNRTSADNDDDDDGKSLMEDDRVEGTVTVPEKDDLMNSKEDDEKTSASGDVDKSKNNNSKVDADDATPAGIACDETFPQSDGEANSDMDDDFDPSLLCPEVSMAVDEAPVITNGVVSNDGNTSPTPSEPLFSTFIDETTGVEISFNLTTEEKAMREKLYGPTNPIQYTKLHCTACNMHLGSALATQKNRYVHPMLKVLICKNCYNFYTSGDFEKDEDGSELYCRWCGQGGQVLCCSKCEFVFCKKCIRNNFGRRKLKEINESDEWNCFRCQPSQMLVLRVSCVEFFEYVRREIGRAATLNDPAYLNEDHSRCCNNNNNPLKRKNNDPDWDIMNMKGKKAHIMKNNNTDNTNYDLNMMLHNHLNQLQPSTSSGTNSGSVLSIPTAAARKQVLPILQQKPPAMPHYVFNEITDNDVEYVGHVGLAISDTTTNNNVVARRYVLHPQHQAPSPMFPPPPNLGRPLLPSPSGYYRFAPPPPQPPALRKMPQMNTTATIQQNLLKTRLLNNGNKSSGGSMAVVVGGGSTKPMKHEWFEKTVRAAAKVNSNLSYTLTQLNKAQSRAGNVEELAVVHNKLQEILSNSINSLIQIRKNLRSEFIAGIKTIRFPPATTTTTSGAGSSLNNNDDDVIFVATPTAAPAPPLLSKICPPSTSFVNPFSSSRVAFTAKTQSIPPLSKLTANKNKNVPYLKVKSMSELQVVTSECITIPDDSLSSSTNNDDNDKSLPLVTTIHNNDDEKVIKMKTDKIVNAKSSFYNLNDNPTDEIKRMLSVKVHLTRCDIDALVKRLADGGNDS